MTKRRHLEAIRRRAVEALREHGLTKQGWTFQWDHAVRRFGYCRFDTQRITISRHLAALNTLAEAENTILHEVAHALVGHGAGHGPRWVAQAQAIGCTGTRCYSVHVSEPPEKWIGTCPGCRAVVARKIRRPRSRRVACGRCCRQHAQGRFDARFALAWVRR
jgi:SprT protein